MNNCLVSGCTGFIGSHLISALLKRNVRVRGLSRNRDSLSTHHTEIEPFQGDLIVPASIAGVTRGMDIVIHAAGYAHAYPNNPGLHHETTLEGTRHLLAEALATGVEHFVFISSVKAMPPPGQHCLDESATGLPEDVYGLSRYHAEELVRDAGRKSGMHICILRPTLVYGAGCKGNLASMLRMIDMGLFPPLPDTRNQRSMVDVRDLVRAIMLSLERESANGKTCIITDNQDYSTRRIYTAMRAALGKSISDRVLPVWLLRSLGKVGDAIEAVTHHPIPYNSALCSRLLDSACYHSLNAKSALGFQPEYQLEDALPEMVKSYRQQVAPENR